MSLITEINWDKRDAFSGQYEFLSNFYGAPTEYRGYMYPTSEHAFAAQKTSNPNERARIALAYSPGEAKMYGRRVTLRADWEEIKDRVMYEIVKDKFTRHIELACKLLDTGTAEIVEWNCWGDVYWGKVIVGRNLDGEYVTKGKNMLGQILMRIRTEIREKGNAFN